MFSVHTPSRGILQHSVVARDSCPPTAADLARFIDEGFRDRSRIPDEIKAISVIQQMETFIQGKFEVSRSCDY